MENNHQIRSHMTKEQRLPKSFKEVEKILRSVKSCRINYKTILANSRLRGNTLKKVYSMTVNVLKNYNYIQKIIDEIQLLEKEKHLRREIASILIYELIFGRGFLPGESKVIKIIQLYENDIFKAHEFLQNRFEGSLTIELYIPRYVRVHTLVTTVSYVIKDLTTYGFNQVLYDNDLSEEKYLELVKNLKKGSFLIDFHFKDVLVFEHHENLVSLDLYKNGHIFLQDKSSYIPVHVLNPKPGCAVLDACAAPGMKTVHIAAKMKNKGLLIACERDKSRFECLKEMLDCGSVKICKTLCKDFKLIDPCDQAYSTIEYILLDPSCSGSGMINRMDEVTDTENSKNIERLRKLAGFQIILLKHSLKFPSVKRVVYSTCSIHEEENEYVVHEALKAFNGTFKLISAMPEWSHRGSKMFEFGKLCLRTEPKVHLTNGFFIAVFERINYDGYSEKCQNNCQNYVHDASSLQKQKRKSSKQEKNSEKTTAENYDNMNLKDGCNITHPPETNQIDDSRHLALLNKNDESFGNSTQNVSYQLEQNLIDAQQINKKYKKKKKKTSKECLFECSELEMPCESASKCTKLKKYTNISFLENNNANTLMSENKSKQNEHHNYEKTATEDYDDTNLKHKCNIAHSVETHQINIRGDIALLNKNGETLENSTQNVNYELEQNLVHVQQIKKEEKKKKKSKEWFYESNELEIPYESALKCTKFKKCSKISLPECNDNANTCTRKEKSEENEHQIEGSLYENTKVKEKFTDVTKLHRKKKKKKKDHFETAMLQPAGKCFPESNELNQEQPNVFYKQKHKISKLKQDENILQPERDYDSDAVFTSKDVSAQNKHLSNTSYEQSEELINMTSLHKKKKRKKEHSNIDYIQSGKKLKEYDISLSCTVSDNINRHRNIENVSENNETPEGLVELTLLHKKKKKKKKTKELSL